MVEPVTNLLNQRQYSVPYRTIAFNSPQELGTTNSGTPIRKISFGTTTRGEKPTEAPSAIPASVGDVLRTSLSPEKLYRAMRTTVVPTTRDLGRLLGGEKGANIAETFVGRPLRGAIDIPLNVWSAIQTPLTQVGGRIPLMRELTGRPQESYLMETLKGQRPKDFYEATTPQQQIPERIGRMAFGQVLAAPLSGATTLAGVGTAALSRAAQGAALGTAFSAVPMAGEAIKTGKLPSRENVLRQLGEGAVRGAENSWMLAFTDLATDKILASKIANSLTGNKSALLQSGITRQAMQPLVAASKAGAPLSVKAPLFARGAGIFLTRALAEVPVENTVWTYLDKMNDKDKRSFFKSWISNLPSTVVGNIAYAGLNTAYRGAVPLAFNKADIDAGIQSLKDTAKQFVTDPQYQAGFARLGMAFGEEKLTPTQLKERGIFINKNDIKTLLQSYPELKATPELTYKDGMLTFEGKTSRVTVKPEAIGVSSQLLKEGDILDISGAEVKTKGNVPVVYETKEKPTIPEVAGRETETLGGQTFYRATDSTNQQANLGKGTYVSELPDLAKRYGKNIESYQLSDKARLLDLRDSYVMDEYQTKAIKNFPNEFRTGGAKDGAARAITAQAKADGYDGIRGEETMFGTVIFNKKLLKPLKEKPAITKTEPPVEKVAPTVVEPGVGDIGKKVTLDGKTGTIVDDTDPSLYKIMMDADKSIQQVGKEAPGLTVEGGTTKPVEIVAPAKPTKEETLLKNREKMVMKMASLAEEGKTYTDPEYDKVSRKIYELDKAIYENVGKQNGDAPPSPPPPPPKPEGESPEDYVKRSVRRQMDYWTPEQQKAFEENIVPQLAPIMDKYKGKGKWTQDDLMTLANEQLLVDMKAMNDPKMQKAMVDMIAAGQAFAKEASVSMKAGEELSSEGVKAYIKFAQAKSFFGRALKAADMTIDPQTKFFYDTLEAKVLNEIMSVKGAGTDIDVEKLAMEASKVDWDNPKEVTAFYRQYVKPSWTEIWSQYRYVNLLSNPLTHFNNALTNSSQTFALKPLTMFTSGLIDSVYSKLSGADQTHYLEEVPAYFRGATSNIGKALDDFVAAYKGEEWMMTPEFRFLSTGGEAPKRDVLGLGGGLSKFGEWGQFIPRLMNASDMFFRDLIAGGELEALKTSAELQGKDITDPEFVTKATDDAMYWLYRQKLDPTGELTGQPGLLRGLDKITGSVMNARSRSPMVNLFIPFVQTPANIVKQGIEFSPLGFLDTAGTQLRSAFDPNYVGLSDPIQQYSKNLLGSLVTLGALAIISHTDSTADAPTDPEERKRWYATGRKPWSILLPTPMGWDWVGIQRLGTMAYPIALAQLFYDRSTNSDARFTRQGLSGTATTALDALWGLIPFFGSQTYVQGLSDMMGLINSGGDDFEYVMSRAASQPLRQSIPFSSFLSAIARVIDPIYRKSTGSVLQRTYQNAATGVPFLSKTLDPYTDPLGNPSSRPPLLLNFFNSLISPIQFSPSVTGYFEMLFLTKGMQSDLNALKRMVESGELTPEQAAIEAEKLIQSFTETTEGVGTELPPGYELEPVLPKALVTPTPSKGVNSILPTPTATPTALPSILPTTIPTATPSSAYPTTTPNGTQLNRSNLYRKIPF